MYSIILCGGSGTRLWPLSRKNFPKQFLNLYSDKSLLQETFLRLREIMPAENIILVTNKENFFNVSNQIKEVEKDFKDDQILTEPASLNTAPAIAFGVKYLADIKKADLNSPVFIAYSDHYIGDVKTYLELLKKSLENIGDNIGTIGITPTKPETGFGYIKKGKKTGEYYQVIKFVEKPDLETAKKYLESGEYVWNSGMYMFKIKTFAEELKKYAPEIYSLYSSEMKTFLENFKNLSKISIDVAISEKSDRVIVFEGDFGWSDIGSFDGLAEVLEGNKNKKHIHIDSKNIFVHSVNDRLVATLGVEDLIIIENNDSILVQKRGRGGDIKKIVDCLNENSHREAEHSLIVHRPWGKYEILAEGPNYKSKKITVNPGAKLSLQSHKRRAEHWVVVNGEAKIINGDQEIILKENQSTYIPIGARHRLENVTKKPLDIIEVQTGDYLEEDDITRYDDIYKRD